MKDLLKDIIESSRDRVKTPITGSFILAFVIYNWRPLLYLIFSNVTIEDKIDNINKTYCDIWALVGPLGIAIVYVAIVPYIMMGLEYCTKKAVEGRKTHKSTQKLFDLTIEKDIAVEEFQIEKIKTGQKEISDLNDKVNSLTTHIENINTQQKSQNENYEKLIEGYINNEDNFKANIKSLEEKIKSEKSNTESLLKLSGIKDVVSKFSNNEVEYFLLFCKKQFFVPGDVTIEFRHIDKFIKLELITNKEGTYDITKFGIGVYNYLEAYLLPF